MGIVALFEKKKRFKAFLGSRFSLRLHMFLILTATFLSGLLATKLLLLLHVNNMLIRYPVAVIFSYLVFFGFVKVWLLYMSSSSDGKKLVSDAAENAGDSIDVTAVPDISVDIPSPSVPLSGGGQFTGGGASGSFEGSANTVTSAPVDTTGGVADAAGDAASGIFEDAGIVLIILGLLLALIFGAGAYLIYEAPAILSEAAFEIALAASLIKRLKKMENPDWMGSVLRTTIGPFLFIFCITSVVAFIAKSAYPKATKLSEVLKYLISNL